MGVLPNFTLQKVYVPHACDVNNKHTNQKAHMRSPCSDLKCVNPEESLRNECLLYMQPVVKLWSHETYVLCSAKIVKTHGLTCGLTARGRKSVLAGGFAHKRPVRLLYRAHVLTELLVIRFILSPHELL